MIWFWLLDHLQSQMGIIFRSLICSVGSQETDTNGSKLNYVKHHLKKCWVMVFLIIFLLAWLRSLWKIILTLHKATKKTIVEHWQNLGLSGLFLAPQKSVPVWNCSLDLHYLEVDLTALTLSSGGNCSPEQK